MSAGGIAGIVHECLHHYTQPFVRLGIEEGLHVITHAHKGLNISFTAVIPSAIGFLAYEYAVRHDEHQS